MAIQDKIRGMVTMELHHGHNLPHFSDVHAHLHHCNGKNNVQDLEMFIFP